MITAPRHRPSLRAPRDPLPAIDRDAPTAARRIPRTERNAEDPDR